MLANLSSLILCYYGHSNGLIYTVNIKDDTASPLYLFPPFLIIRRFRTKIKVPAIS